MHRVILQKSGQQVDISQQISNIAWSSHIDAIGSDLTFDIVYGDTAYLAGADVVEIGDILALMGTDGSMINQYVVVKKAFASRFRRTVTCFDFGWYLNQNETIIQFNRLPASSCIRKLLDKFGVKHDVADMVPVITKIYKDITVSDCIKDILEQVKQETGAVYRLEASGDTILIYPETDLLINPMVRMSDNTPAFPAVLTITNPSRELSIESMKNKVIVTSSNEDSLQVLAETSDDTAIAQYGLLTEVVTVDEKNESQARQIAGNTLSEMNRVGETVSCELLGHDSIRAGRLIDMNEPTSGMIGRYRIKTAAHTINNGIHRTKVDLEAV